jgi:hypothetical protein
MDRRGSSNTWIIAVLAIAVGFLAALLIFGGNDSDNTSATVAATSSTTTGATTAGTDTAQTQTTGSGTTATTVTTQANATPGSPPRSEGACLDLWNQANNRGDQTFLVSIMARQPIRVHVGVTSDVPAKCLITVVANNGDAYVFPEAGGATYPYAQAPGKSSATGLPAAQKTSNALEQSDGTLKAR